LLETITNYPTKTAETLTKTGQKTVTLYGEDFSGYARMSGKSQQAISKRVKVHNQTDLKTAEIQTAGGFKVHNLIPESLIQKWIIKDNPDLSESPRLTSVVRKR